MSTPNPLIPQGTFQAQAAKGASNVRIAVATIVAIHVVFFGGLLLQGCKRDTQTGQTTSATGPTNAETSTNLGLPPLDSSSLYYSNSSNLPSDTSATAAAQPGTTATTPGLSSASQQDALWQPTNLSSSLTQSHETAGAQSSGATKSYTVVRGDSFSRIASRNGTTVSALRAANPEVDPTRIKPGDKLNVPEAAPKASPTTLTGAPAPTGAGPAAPGNIYVVKQGDTLSRIAKSHGVTISQLRAANPNSLKTSRVNVGQKLKIPPPNPSQASTAGSNTQRTPNL